MNERDLGWFQPWDRLPSRALEQWLAGLSGAKFTLPGYLFAGLTITETTSTLERFNFWIQALTVES